MYPIIPIGEGDLMNTFTFLVSSHVFPNPLYIISHLITHLILSLSVTTNVDVS